MSNKNIMENSDTKIEVHPPESFGVASKSVSIIGKPLPVLEDSSLDLFSPKLTYDTFQSLGNKQGKNCYTISWNKAVEIDQIIMTMGFPYRSEERREERV